MKDILQYILHNKIVLIGMLIGFIASYIYWYYFACYWGTYPLYIFSIKFTDCLDFDLSVLIKTSIFINYQNIRYHE